MSDSNKRQRTEGESSAANHHLKANVCTVICSKCDCLLQKRGLNLWIPDRKVIWRHWNEKHCYIGEKLPSATEVESQLRAEQIAIHEKILRHPAEAKSLLDQDFPSELCILSKMKCCSKCGFTSNETKDHKKHYGKSNQYGCLDLLMFSDLLVFLLTFMVQSIYISLRNTQ